jgi:hypothetical protein
MDPGRSTPDANSEVIPMSVGKYLIKDDDDKELGMQRKTPTAWRASSRGVTPSTRE